MYSLSQPLLESSRNTHWNLAWHDPCNGCEGTEYVTYWFCFNQTQISRAEAVSLILLPLLFVVLWLAAVAFLIYDNHLRRYIHKEIHHLYSLILYLIDARNLQNRYIPLVGSCNGWWLIRLNQTWMRVDDSFTIISFNSRQLASMCGQGWQCRSLQIVASVARITWDRSFA